MGEMRNAHKILVGEPAGKRKLPFLPVDERIILKWVLNIVVRYGLDSRLSDIMVNLLTIGPNVRGLKPGLGNVFLRAIKIRSTPSFGGEVKPGAPCRKISLHV
jgi:hypothetical protein